MKPKEAERSLLGCVRFANACEMKWTQLERTTDPKRRHCGECSKSVFWCENAIEAGLRVQQNECIAVPNWLVEGPAVDSVEGITIGQGTLRAYYERVEKAHLALQKNTEE